jgi:predicted nucleic acid-binding protein
MIVADASATVTLLLALPGSERIARWFSRGGPVHVPEVLYLEVVHVLRRRVRHGELNTELATQAFENLVLLPTVRHSHHPFLPRIWTLRDNLTAYDAMYVALAEAWKAPLLTCDRKLAAAPGHIARIEVV